MRSIYSPEAQQLELLEVIKNYPSKRKFGKPIFKRYDIGDGLGGWDFRPFGKWNYGYPMKEWTMFSWPVWFIEIVFSFSESWSRGLAINAFSHFMQEVVVPVLMPELGGGASFGHNLLAGYNIVRNWNSKSGMRLWARRAGFLDVVVDGILIPVEQYSLEADFNTQISHSAHALGFAIGSLAALI